MPLFNDLIKQLRDRHVALGNMADQRLAARLFASDVQRLRIAYGDKTVRAALHRALGKPKAILRVCKITGRERGA